MYYLNPPAATLHLDTLAHFSSIAALVLQHGEQTINRCLAAQRECLAALREERHENGLPKPGPAAEILKQHTLLLTREWFEGIAAVQEHTIRSFESHAHGMNKYLAYAIDKAGKVTPPEGINAISILKNAVSTLDSTVANIADNAVQAVEQLEEEVTAEATATATVATAPTTAAPTATAATTATAAATATTSATAKARTAVSRRKAK
ncbi:MAG TPA: hypothetical protein VJ548_01895 [Azospira sp.]|nr:hypothetical protein [Azospira sp.]